MSHWGALGIPNVSVTQEQVDARLQCSICLEDYGLRDQVLQLDCGHCFHETCLSPWLTHNNICPTCRSRAIRSSTSFPSSPQESTVDYTIEVENLVGSGSMASLDLESDSEESYFTDTISIYEGESMSEGSAEEEECESDDSSSDILAVLELMEDDDLSVHGSVDDPVEESNEEQSIMSDDSFFYEAETDTDNGEDFENEQ